MGFKLSLTFDCFTVSDMCYFNIFLKSKETRHWWSKMRPPITSTKATEAMCLNEGPLIFLQRGRLVYRPEADVGGIDFLLAPP